MRGTLNHFTWLIILQVEELRETVREAGQEKRAAEEEKTHAHEQVLSLIRECNALEEQVRGKVVTVKYLCSSYTKYKLIPSIESHSNKKADPW